MIRYGINALFRSGILLYRWALHVPLLVKLPGGARGGTAVKEPTGLVDVLPTVAGLLGLRLPEGLAGRSAFAPHTEPRRLYAETYYPRLHLGWSDLRSLVDDRWQYIEGRRRELYDLAADSRELQDVLAGNGDIVRARQKELGIIPADLVPNPGVPASAIYPTWDQLTDDQKKIEARKMEVYAAMVENLDYNIGRIMVLLSEKLPDTVTGMSQLTPPPLVARFRLALVSFATVSSMLPPEVSAWIPLLTPVILMRTLPPEV